MEQIALTIKQMNRLKELGVDTSMASMKFISVYPSCDCDEDELCEYIPVDCRLHAKIYNEDGKTFTLQDILELLPNSISKDGCIYDLTSDMRNSIVYKRDCESVEDELLDEDDFYLHIESDGSNLLDMAYRMLCWVAKNGYLNKKEE